MVRGRLSTSSLVKTSIEVVDAAPPSSSRSSVAAVRTVVEVVDVVADGPPVAFM